MPFVNDDGRVLLVLCTEDGPQERWVDLGEPQQKQPHQDSEDGPSGCPFALHTPVVHHTSVDLPLPLMGPGQDLWLRSPFTHHSAGFYWHYDARGPPALS
ncbi:DUF2946 domain-containing protein [Phaeobacter sp. B1627]|uniref:DUF2946 domain-containing protein n=1 Tax=Phaeobacter sp. B1627 TaxID=2583809 RepID=UPI0011197BD4|nr:DUF2946 domain-containing protein [Phaeobacter sp. B1627]